LFSDFVQWTQVDTGDLLAGDPNGHNGHWIDSAASVHPLLFGADAAKMFLSWH
jgi:hypothetical protein